MVTVANVIQNDQLRQKKKRFKMIFVITTVNFVSLLKYKRQMPGSKLCVNLLRYAAQVYTICYPSFILQ